MLAITDVFPYLLRRNLTSPQLLCDSDFVVEEISRRNRNFKVTSRLGPCYLLKQGADSQRIESVAHEGAVYHLLQSQSRHEAFRHYLPFFHGYDADEHILILEFVRGARNLADHHARRGRFSTALARTLGDALATLHRQARVEGGNDAAGALSSELPWVLYLHRPDLRTFQDISGANVRVFKIVQQFADFGELLDGLRKAWRPETLIHFDIKWDNCIVSRAAQGRGNALKIVDWELAGVGDPGWDAGSVFADYLSFWLLSMPITGDTPPDRFPDLARYPLNKMQPAMLSFWQSYARRMGFDAAAYGESLLLAVRYGAARMLQTVYEQMQVSVQVTGNVICFLQLSLNILRRPEEAAVHLLGIPLEGMRMP